MKGNKFNIDKILKKVAKSDESAFKTLFYHYYSGLLNYAFVIVKNHESAEDIVLEVMHSIWERRSKLNEIKNFDAFIYISTRNKTLDYLKKNSRLIYINFDKPHYKESITHHNPEKYLLDQEFFDLIDKAVLSLPEKTRLVYRLIKEEGLKYQEAADLLGVSIKTINNQLLRAMKVIRENATAYLADDKKSRLFKNLGTLFF